MTTPTYATVRQSAWTYAPPGFLGSTFMLIGSLGIGWFPLSANSLSWPIINFFQTQNLGIALARAFLVVGAALLIQAWLMVGLDAVKGRIENLRTLLFTLSAWILPLLFAVPLFSRDVYSYYMQGQMQLSGHSPYTSGVAVVPGWFGSGVDPLWGEAPSPYGPLFLLFERFIAGLSGESALISVLYFRLLAVVGVALMAWQLPKLAQRHGIDPKAALWLGVLNPLVIFHFVAGAHNDALMLGFTIWGLNLALEKRFLSALVLLTLAIAIKPSAFIVLPFLALLLLVHFGRSFS
ncbi:MAG: polyprenol phosphomannose-dependent alpha 1,6 mannosyltransferase MptB, partial [Actinomycetales bacterium]|nr:polyprenol phosphomannose-dependent alpha 1,6 mannosyltransferase MptB [Actinomycetales bacterium]